MYTHTRGHHRTYPASHRLLKLAFLLTGAFTLVEIIGGYFAHSLALLEDATHIASDVVTLGIAVFTSWISVRPPSQKHSYGFGRAEVIATWTSSLFMIFIIFIIIVEAIQRIRRPLFVHSVPVIVITIFGILLNVLIASLLSHSEKTLNIRTILLHVVSDIVSTCTVLLSGIIIFFTQWSLIDSWLSIFIGTLLIISNIRLWRESMIVLMEGVPSHLNIQKVSQTITCFEGIKAVHDVHIWALSSGVTVLSAHVSIINITSWDNVLLGLKSTLKKQYQIDHITLQPEATIKECASCWLR